MDMNLEDYEETAEIIKALGHPIRLCITKGLIENGRCNVSYMEECLAVSQSGVSQHLSKLKNAGIVKGVRTGNEIYYEVVSERAQNIIRALYGEQ
ncbi:metalloregulator ArsR/SmtB family transcription factor [Acetobacterium paludosum]|uniref:Metalloregulator ArsR/SmtB family transcription factor n=2 Tax=Acetobacterium TaxID=33951 RepID=A0A923I062_9FIRM|nr:MULTISPECIES: metalloregulator ArsR/SmtB family transcription factor [Acetobacterium]MBC3796215.1 metalloregulator ArsR/SmtB family transcription factor [Acetobacterium tundrae]MBC3889839.1 metalloregulator ArsR/SmtB family transcription factor [Acetobacterium paludosum]